MEAIIRYATKKIDKSYKKKAIFAVKGESNNDKRKNVKTNW